MGKALVIVESPAKARTIERFLGDGFRVESSIGHIRDLPGRAADIPPKLKKESWARLGVNVDNGFEPLYIIPPNKKPQVAKLRQLLKDADELYLATDEDREGEAIAWHLREVLKPKVPVKRMVFSEITESAIQGAMKETRAIDERMVNAQEARRVLDRLYGYEVSPVLWKKVKPRLSAGRVQSVATRLVVERERARMRFHSAEYWDLAARLEKAGSGRGFDAKMIELDGVRLATGRDFDENTGKLKLVDGEPVKVELLDGDTAAGIVDALDGAPFVVKSVQEKPFTRKPYAPFITSTLQQEASRKLRFSAQRTMRTAQGLYENGFITYMRTDSIQLSGQAIEAARTQIEELYGKDFLPEEARQYSKKSKNAQEAHEAIRPAGRAFRRPADVQSELDPDAFKLYELIWKRTVASQMKDARGLSTSVRFVAAAGSRETTFASSGRVLQFAGFLRAYVEGSDDPNAELEDQEKILPAMKEGEEAFPRSLEPLGHETQPPARFTDASLVKELEERGIGRPSTYASIIQTIQDRGYVWKKGSALTPTFTAFAVTNLLELHLSSLVDFDFTARMEGDLDEIASGDREAKPWLHAFYFGGEEEGQGLALQRLIGSGWEDIDARAVSSWPVGKDEAGDVVMVRVGRYGPYLQVGDSDVRANIREDIAPDELDIEMATDLLRKAALGDMPLGTDPETGLEIFSKTGRFGDYVQLGVPELDAKGKIKVKPKMASLWPGMTRETLTLEEALGLLAYPKELGPHHETGEMITSQDGKFGPYLKAGTDSRSLENHEHLASITYDQAIALFKEPKRRGRQAASLLELGVHPRTELEMKVKDGRFGPYVTDGAVNASLPKDKNPKLLTLEEGAELIDRREEKMRAEGKDPRAKTPKVKAAKKKAAKKKVKKKATKKKAAKKAPAKKPAKAAAEAPSDSESKETA